MLRLRIQRSICVAVVHEPAHIRQKPIAHLTDRDQLRCQAVPLCTLSYHNLSIQTLKGLPSNLSDHPGIGACPIWCKLISEYRHTRTRALERTACVWRSIVMRSMMGAAEGHPSRCNSWLYPVAASSLCPFNRLSCLMQLSNCPCCSDRPSSTDYCDILALCDACRTALGPPAKVFLIQYPPLSSAAS